MWLSSSTWPWCRGCCARCCRRRAAVAQLRLTSFAEVICESGKCIQDNPSLGIWLDSSDDMVATRQFRGFDVGEDQKSPLSSAVARCTDSSVSCAEVYRTVAVEVSTFDNLKQTCNPIPKLGSPYRGLLGATRAIRKDGRSSTRPRGVPHPLPAAKRSQAFTQTCQVQARPVSVVGDSLKSLSLLSLSLLPPPPQINPACACASSVLRLETSSPHPSN